MSGKPQMRKSDAKAMMLDAVKESIARAKSLGDFDRTRKYQQLIDDIDAGRLTIQYGDSAKLNSEERDE